MLSLSWDLPCSVRCGASLFTNPLPWPHGMVKCPLDVHFRILTENVGHLSIFCIMFNKWTYNSFLLLFFRLLFRREFCIFGCSHSDSWIVHEDFWTGSIDLLKTTHSIWTPCIWECLLLYYECYKVYILYSMHKIAYNVFLHSIFKTI